MVRRFLIDTDTASDDAVALVMALKYPDVRVEAITVVAGNVPLDQAVQNALYTVELAGATVPVHAGAAAPLLRPLETAQNVHGIDGMGDIHLPLTSRTPTPGHAVDVLVETINRYPGEITLVTLGPLTNIALAVLRDPSIAGKVAACVVMGGIGRGYGNVTPVAEFNIWADPEAAKIVFGAGLPLTMVGWDMSYRFAVFGPEDAAALRAIGTPLATFCVDIQGVLDVFAREVSGLAGFDLPDPIAMAVALEPTVATATEQRFVAIETGGEWCRGQTVVDIRGMTGLPANTTIVLEASRERFVAMLHDAVRG
ncbi:MAG: nucleoside hydrolase [Thermomicrobiales bacterium]